MADSHYNVAKLLIIGLIFHVLYIGSVFDCYFTSPVVNGMKSHSVSAAEAKRLVLIIGDGLRADLLFSPNANASETVAPHLRSIVESRGAFGISHTRVPTESRPGHVAIIGGMYEDVSAVTKGWKSNPVDFDSIFNQSSTTFSFGSPDILPMFSQGATPGKVKTWSYNEEDEDFTKDATALDIWVLDQLQELFHNASTDPLLNSQLRSNKTVFFLHLLGLDTTGHSYRPHSKEYMNNIQVVDDIVRQTETLFTEFFQDEETSFIFTADHGMSVIGNHGDGHPDNTRTPLVAWGCGIRGPLPDSSPSSHDAYSNPWQLNHLLRRDVDQADIAPLMAALIGINWPVNSVGVLPDVDPTRPGYLSPQKGDEMLAQSSLVNAKVILEHYHVKHELKESHTLFYKPFPALHMHTQPAALAMIEQSIADKDWFTARKLSLELIKTSLAGLHYLQTYDRLLIRAIVTAAYVGWAGYASLYIFRPLEVPNRANEPLSFVITTVSAITLLGFWCMFAIQRSPWTYYIYIAFPCYFWQQILMQGLSPVKNWLRTTNKASDYVKLFVRSILVVGTLQAMVVAYTHRSIWSVGFVIIGIVWPLVSWPSEMRSEYGRMWVLLCLITGSFPLAPVDKKENLKAIFMTAMFMLPDIAGALTSARLQEQDSASAPKKSKFRRLSTLFNVQAILIAAITVITISSARSINAKKGLPLFNQVSGWVLLISASSLPFISRVQHTTVDSKLMMYYLGFGACFIILSISFEGLFYIMYSLMLLEWIKVETAYRGNTVEGEGARSNADYRFQPDDLRIALFFLFFVQVGFFGTGNVASISSFYLEPVYRLIPIFSPFFMAALLIFKIIAPYVMLSVTFATLNHKLRLPPFSLFLVALTLTDVMTLTFFFNVTDTGSWLEIGQSISFFCITSLLLLWSAGICVAGEYLMADVIRPSPPVPRVVEEKKETY